jgi:uncharacterized protein (DUF169 family)
MTATEFQALVGLAKPPIAIGFLDEAPKGVEKWEAGAVPAGCAFWRFAFSGRTFYTEPADHENCAVGAHTHGITAPDRVGVLQETIAFMTGNGYIRMEEVPGIPALRKAPRYIAFGPVGAGLRADLVLVAARPAAAMLLFEAAVRSGAAAGTAPALGRPACALLPLTEGTGGAAFSLGCKGNRTFTGLPEDELYFCVPAGKWEAFTASVEELHGANACMSAYYQEHQARFPVMG